MNRAPSSNDTWWAEHQATCGGTYTKIKEPDDYRKKKKGNNKKEQGILLNDNTLNLYIYYGLWEIKGMCQTLAMRCV